ncbi:MAG TPA: SgcJ/EcaC family oxidoreductase [Gemmataceae bacterium]|nr:SgcJ/EcaC family oxidoreductase [Gemmataceae bacterium]
MAVRKRTLTFRVEVFETDEEGRKDLCSLQESYTHDSFFQRQRELFQLAYEAFNLARNKLCMSSDEQAIRDLIQTWIDASKAGDTDRVLSLMQDDVVFLTVGQQPFGKAEFEAASRAGKGKVAIDATMDLREVTVVGDVGYTLNHLTITITPTAGEPRKLDGHILTVFRKQPDGRWLLARDANLLTPQH